MLYNSVCIRVVSVNAIAIVLISRVIGLHPALASGQDFATHPDGIAMNFTLDRSGINVARNRRESLFIYADAEPSKLNQQTKLIWFNFDLGREPPIHLKSAHAKSISSRAASQ